MHDDNPPLDAAFMAGMTPSRRGRPKSDTPKVEVKSPPGRQNGSQNP